MVRDQVDEPADRPRRVQPLGNDDGVQAFDDSVFEHAGVPTRTAGPQHHARKPWISETERKLEARLPRLRYLQQRRTGPQDIADANCVLVEAERREVLAKAPWHEHGGILGQFALPRSVMLSRVEVDCLLGAAMNRGICLGVARHAKPSDGDRTHDGQLYEATRNSIRPERRNSPDLNRDDRSDLSQAASRIG